MHSINRRVRRPFAETSAFKVIFVERQSPAKSASSEAQRRSQSQKGFSLIELVIAIGIVAIISSAISSMVTNMFDLENRFRISQDGRSLQYEMEQIIKRPLCGINNLDTKTFDANNYSASKPFDLPDGLTGMGLTLLPNSTYGILDLVSIKIEPWTDKTTNPYTFKYIIADDGANDFISANRVKAQLTITYVKKGERKLIGTKDQPKIFRINHSIYLAKNPDNPNNIIGCYPEDTDDSGRRLCESLGGSYDTSVVPAACHPPNNDSNNTIACLQNDPCGISSRYIVN